MLHFNIIQKTKIALNNIKVYNINQIYLNIIKKTIYLIGVNDMKMSVNNWNLQSYVQSFISYAVSTNVDEIMSSGSCHISKIASWSNSERLSAVTGPGRESSRMSVMSSNLQN